MAAFADREPFLHIRACGESFEVNGLTQCVLGHPLDGAGAHAGIFAEWNWDGHELVVRNDRYGAQPLFYYTGRAEICVAPMLWTLLEQGAPRELDDEALAVFFRLGFFLREDTPFRRIKAVPPNATLNWNRSGLRLHSKPPMAAGAAPIARDRALRVYQELFSRAVQRRLPTSPFACLLSGGRDSRHILFELMCQGHKPELAATVAVPTNTDAAISAQIAKELDLRVMLMPPTQPTVRSELRRNVETHFCADEHGWIFDLRDALRGRVNLLYDGLAGDVLSAGLFLNQENLTLMREARFADLARRLIAEENVEAFVMQVFGEEEKCSLGEIASGRLAEELEAHAGAANPLGSFFFWNRTRREIALSPFSIFRMFHVHVPFLDDELFDFLTSLPAEHFLDHTFHDEAIARSYPQWSQVPYATKHSAPFSRRRMCFAWQTLRWLRAHTSERLKLRYLTPRLARAAFDPWFNRRSSPYLTNLPIYQTCLEELGKGMLGASI